jgi:hypothetical protein
MRKMINGAAAFDRADESDDAAFYATERSGWASFT